MLINDMYTLASAGDLEGFMTLITLVMLYGMLFLLGVSDFLNKRG